MISFKPSAAHNDSDIYRLKDGKWILIKQKAVETLRSGEAFWIFCKGKSNYSGPVNLDVGSFSGLIVGGNTGEIKIKNLSNFPIELTLKHFLETGKPQPIDFGLRVLDDPDNPIQNLNLKFPDKSWTLDCPPPSGQGITVSKSRSLDMLEDSYHSLLCVESGIGTETGCVSLTLRITFRNVCSKVIAIEFDVLLTFNSHFYLCWVFIDCYFSIRPQF